MKKPAPKNPNSPWRRGPACDTGRAKASYIHYAARGKRMHREETKR